MYIFIILSIVVGIYDIDHQVTNLVHCFDCFSRGVLVGILGGGVPPCSPNPDPISDQKLCFTHRFSD